MYCHMRVYLPSVSVSTEAFKAAARYAFELTILSVGTKGNAKSKAEQM